MALTIRRGDTTSFALELRASDGSIASLVSATLWFTVKQAYDNDVTDAAAAVKNYIVINGSGVVTSSSGIALGGKRPSDGVTVTGAADGVVTVTISSAQSTLLQPGDCPWDVQVLKAGAVQTAASGTIAVTADVTRRITTP